VRHARGLSSILRSTVVGAVPFPRIRFFLISVLVLVHIYDILQVNTAQISHRLYHLMYWSVIL